MTKRSKPTRRSALRFDTMVNGTRYCLAGSGRYGVLALNLVWVKRDPKKRPPQKTAERWGREECHLRIGAMTGDYQEAWEPLTVKEGDEITIRVLGPGRSDIPPSRSRVVPVAIKPVKSEAAARWDPTASSKSTASKPVPPSDSKQATPE
ncbi:MAG: hypothetical protein N3D11_10830 [Candidatus Sumerlaeia bacterium]|nr:hypothetical protein [Candidatus Sumerlaeia bacterium]